MDQRKEQLDFLTILRGILCIGIILYHFQGVSQLFGSDNLLANIIDNGNYSVDAFFCISGFCVAYNYRDRLINNKYSIFKFVRNNFKKIFIFVLITMPFALLKHWLVYKAGLDSKPSVENALYDLLCIRGVWTPDFPYNSPLWFCNVLLLIYILYAFITFLSKKLNRSGGVYFGLLVAFAMVGFALLMNPSFTFLCFREVPGRGMLNFFIGAIVYEAYEKTNSNKYLKVINWIYVVLYIGAMILLYELDKMALMGNIRMVYSFLFWPFLVLGASLIKKQNAAMKPFIMLGTMSNSFFIWHHPILYIIYGMSVLGIIEVEMNSWLLFVVYVLIVVGVGVLSGRYIEKYAMKLMNRIM